MKKWGNSRASEVSDSQIVEAYQSLKSSNAVAKKLGIGQTTVLRVLARLNMPRIGLAAYRQNATFFVGEEQKIRDWYESGKTIEEIKQLLGRGSQYSITMAIRRAGGTLRQTPAHSRITEDELAELRSLHDSGLGQLQISLRLGRSQSFVSRNMRKHGVATHSISGENHSQWKGGRFLSDGYWRVLVAADDPMASMRDSSGYVLEHRLVMARMINRPLLPTETVHHIDGDRQHNAPENLQLRQGRHGKHVAMVCLDCGSHNVGPAKLKDKTT